VSGARPTFAGADSDRVLAGRLVHRLFQFCGGADGDQAEWRTRADRLLSDDERSTSDDVDSVIAEAVDLFARLRERADVRAAIEAGPCFYEVPFSIWTTTGDGLVGGEALGGDDGPVVVRGVIDCLVVPEAGDVVVLDFKTGTPRESDERQMAIYVEAARRAFPGREVQGRLVYAGEM
jgi:ATP-dependent exoDNAse (exonuclease V) beta subunit